MKKVKTVNKKEFEKIKEENQNRRDPNSIKGQLFDKFDEIEVDGSAIEIKSDGDVKLEYAQSLVSQYNREEHRPDVKLRTLKNKDQSAIYVYAEAREEES